MQKGIIDILKAIVSVALLSASVPATAENGLDGSSPAYSFMNITSSSRIYAMGGINLTVIDPNDVMTIDQNPALLGPEYGSQIGTSYMHWLGTSNFAAPRACNSVGEHGAWSAAIRYFGYGKQTLTESDGTISGELSPSDTSFESSFSHDLTDRLRGGFAIKTAYSHYGDYTALALATDLGLSYYDQENDFSVSAVVANLGGQIKRFDNAYDRLPIDVRAGISKRMGVSPVKLSVTAWNLTKWRLPYYDNGDGSEDSEPEIKDSFGSNLMRHLIFAADITPTDRFHLSVGYNYKIRTDMATYSRNILSGFSLGAGFNVSSFGIGVALAQPHIGATTVMVNFTANIYDLTH
ncbi:MAG: type IX secretion system protein PorQ [Muribaculaceae bacterium]|nr:type IX secretion system protein PorQ [Muribaculaceae bacterium]